LTQWFLGNEVNKGSQCSNADCDRLISLIDLVWLNLIVSESVLLLLQCFMIIEEFECIMHDLSHKRACAKIEHN